MHCAPLGHRLRQPASGCRPAPLFQPLEQLLRQPPPVLRVIPEPQSQPVLRVRKSEPGVLRPRAQCLLDRLRHLRRDDRVRARRHQDRPALEGAEGRQGGRVPPAVRCAKDLGEGARTVAERLVPRGRREHPRCAQAHRGHPASVVPYQVRHRLAAHAEADQDEGAGSGVGVDHRDRLLEAAAQAEFAQAARAAAVAGEVEGQGVAAPLGEGRQQGQQLFLAAGARAVEQYGGGACAGVSRAYRAQALAVAGDGELMHGVGQSSHPLTFTQSNRIRKRGCTHSSRAGTLNRQEVPS